MAIPHTSLPSSFFQQPHHHNYQSSSLQISPHRFPTNLSASLSSSSSNIFSTSIFVRNPSSNASKDSKRSYSRVISVELSSRKKPLKVMITGAPASGKGTQCELIVKHHDIVHVSAGDLLRAEIAAGTENGKKAKEYMTRGDLVPNEILVKMVKDRLSQSDAQEKGWLLDGYPRSESQAEAIEAEGIRPDVFIVLEVPDNILIERVIGRRLDPVTGKIYHLKYLPPESKEIEERLTQRFDDTEHQAKLRLQTHSRNVDAVIKSYKDILRKVNGDRPKEEVFHEIDDMLSEFLEKKAESMIGATGSKS